MSTKTKNLDILKSKAVNGLKAIWRSTITLSGTIQTLATDLAAIEADGKGQPLAATFDVVSTELLLPVARFTLEGTAPVAATTGRPMYNKDERIIDEFYNLQRFKIVQDGAYTTTIEVTYYK